jgi:hypothetical protein
MAYGIAQLSSSLIGMGYEPRSYVPFAGPKSISRTVACMLIELRADKRVFIPYKVQLSEHYALCKVVELMYSSLRLEHQ